jgi:hypothetical protein
VRLRVYNATNTAGLAQQVAADLKGRGFTVDEVANDPTDRQVTGVGEIRHGHPGTDAAAYMSVYLAGATDWLDTRATGLVDVVIGPEFTALRTPDEVAAQLNPASSAAAVCNSVTGG